MAGSEIDGVFTLFYIFFSYCLIAPPTEFASAGITLQNVLSDKLGSEELRFVDYHIRRTTYTVIFHSLFPLGYYVTFGLFAPQKNLFLPWEATQFWQMFLVFSLIVIVLAVLVAYYWSQKQWKNHPIAKQLKYLGNGNPWTAVAASINTEFRRFDKFTSGKFAHRLIVTDSWVIKTSTYFVYIAHQNDIHLNLTKSEEHAISYENMTATQFLNFNVISINPHLSPFTIRLNSLEYRDLRDKLQAPVVNARNVVIHQSLSDKFLQAFRDQIAINITFTPPTNMELEQCIGCMQKQADVKLVKLCDNLQEGECRQCYCRPMWCAECMGKWFASRQDQQRPDTWLGSKCPCPTCRATFCMLDVCRIVS